MLYKFAFTVDLKDSEDPEEMLDYFEQSIQENLEDISSIYSARVDCLNANV